MKIGGFNARLNKNIGYRHSDPKRDFDKDGNPVEPSYVSFVKLKDCYITRGSNGESYYNPKDAPSIPVGYGGTYYGYGRWYKRKSETGVWIDDKLLNEYMQCTVYFVNSGYVYTTSVKREIDDDLLLREKAGLERRAKAMYEAGLQK